MWNIKSEKNKSDQFEYWIVYEYYFKTLLLHAISLAKANLTVGSYFVYEWLKSQKCFKI